MSRDLPRDFLLLGMQLMKLRGGSKVLEIGTSRAPMGLQCWTGTNEQCCQFGHSTLIFASQCQVLWTVDIDPLASEMARRNLEVWKHRVTATVNFLVGDAITILRTLKEPVDLLYFDAWDVMPCSEYAVNHLKAYHAARHLLLGNSVVVIDDVDFEDRGKGALLVPHLLAEGWQLVALGRQAILVQDSTGLCALASWRMDYCASLSTSLQRVAEELVGRVWKYERVGFDTRRMTFSRHGTVLDGAQGCEVFWDLTEHKGRIELKLRSLTELTCSLIPAENGDWLGRWEHHEKMPVRLSYWAYSDEFPRVPRDEKWLIACPVNQLGNCLRGIVSCHILAKYYGRVCKVYLGLNGSYSLEYFRAIFASTAAIDFVGSVPEEAVFIGRNQPEYNLREENTFRKPDWLPVGTFRTTSSLHVEAIADLTRFDHVNCFAVSTFLSVCPAGMPSDEFLSARISWYREVKWNQKIVDAVEKFSELCRESIGVHIRHTDNLVDREKSESGGLTPLSEYFSRLREYPNNATFLLFSDSREVISLCRERFGDRVRSPPQLFTGIQQALFEMLLLSRTKEIVGSALSTFSYESAFMGNCKISLYKGGDWESFLPSCLDHRS